MEPMLEELEELNGMREEMEKSLSRLMNNETLYTNFLKRFLDDANYRLLKDAVASGDGDAAFKAAHTLKGVAANLGLENILKPVSAIAEEYRNGKMDAETVCREWETLSASYKEVCGIIKKYI